MLVLDRSQSMATAMEPGAKLPTRWDALSSALGSVLPPVDKTMAIGALIFPKATSTSGKLDCSVASEVSLRPAKGNVAALTRLMGATLPGGGTPTAVAIDTAARFLLGLRTATAARALVLATDGGPNCNRRLDATTCRCTSLPTPGTNTCVERSQCLDDASTERTISEYQSQELPTYVIGIETEGDPEFSDVLDAMAVAGGRPQVGATQSYYAASSEAALNAALTTIRNQVGSCTYLTSSVPDPNGSIVVSIDGVELAPDQWMWGDRNNGEIILQGDACQTAAIENAPALRAVVECTGSE
jgi:hypothetical protein